MFYFPLWFILSVCPLIIILLQEMWCAPIRWPGVCNHKKSEVLYHFLRSLWWQTATFCHPACCHTWSIEILRDSMPLQVPGSWLSTFPLWKWVIAAVKHIWSPALISQPRKKGWSVCNSNINLSHKTTRYDVTECILKGTMPQQNNQTKCYGHSPYGGQYNVWM